MNKKYKYQKCIFVVFVLLSMVSSMALVSSAAQAVSDDAAIIYLFPDGINVPIEDFGVDIDTSEYVDIDPYKYIPIDEGDVLITFNKAQMMYYELDERYNWIKVVEPLIGYPGASEEGQSYLTLRVNYIEYDWSSAPNHFNVHFSIEFSGGGEVWNDGIGDGNIYYQQPVELWIFDTNQMKIDDSNPILFYMVTQGMLLKKKHMEEDL